MTLNERIEKLESIVEALLERNAMANSVISGLIDQVKNLQKRVAELEGEDFREDIRIICNDLDKHTDRINHLEKVAEYAIGLSQCQTELNKSIGNSIQALTKMTKRNRNSIMEHVEN